MPDKAVELKIWNAKTGAEILNIKGPIAELFETNCGGLAFHPDGKRIAALMEGELKIWDVESGNVVHSFPGIPHIPTSLIYSSDGKRIAATGASPAITIWDAETGKELQVIKNTTDNCGVAVSHDLKRVAYRAKQTVEIWDVAAGAKTHTFKSGSAYGVAFNPTDDRLATATNTTIKIWQAKESQGDLTFKASTIGVGCMVMNSAGDRIATASPLVETKVKVWDVRTGKLVFDLRGHKDFASSLAFSGDGKILASASRDGTTRIWDMNDGTNRATLEQSEVAPRESGEVAISPDGNFLAASDSDETVRIWNLRSQEAVCSLPAATGGMVMSLAFSPDSKQLASGSWGAEQLILWDVQSGRKIAHFPGHSGGVTAIAFDTDGQRLASGSVDSSIKIWDLKTGRELGTLLGHTQGVSGVTFSSDGKRIASAGGDGTIRLWETKNYFEVANLTGSAESLVAVAFGPNDRTLAFASMDGMVKVCLTNTQQVQRDKK